MATKKKTAKKRGGTGGGKLDVGSDPPILVGGGGSVYLWTKLDQDERPVNPQLDNAGIGINPGAPTPKTRSDYSCCRLKNDPSPDIFFFDGTTKHKLKILNFKTWFLQID